MPCPGVWGTNFVVIKVALGHLPPLLFGTLRFTFALLPAVFFLPRPAVGWRNLAGYGLLIGAGQFGLLYLAMRSDISLGLSMALTRERVRGYQWLALALAVSGVAIIGAHTDGNTTWKGLAMVLVAAFSWACGNTLSRRAGQVNMLAYVVWSSLFALPPLLVLSLVVEGWPAIETGLRTASAATWAAVLWQSAANSLFGYAAWGWLLARHPAATITPMALLVPVFGMGASALMLAEPLPLWKLLAAGLVMAGLALNLLWPRWRMAVAARAAR